jgi:hypothetical protein
MPMGNLGEIRGVMAKFILAPVLLCVMVPAGQALALESIGISPVSQEVALDPGAQSHGQLTVINDGDTVVQYKVYAADYSVSGEAYHPVFNPAGTGPNNSAVSWFKLPNAIYTVRGGTESTFAYSITAPKAAAVGGHYTAIFIQTIPPPSPGGTHIARVTRLASIFYITVSGALVHTGSLLPIQMPYLQTNSPIQAGLRFSNTGNVHYLATATAQLSTPFGKVGSPMAISGEILPYTTRRFGVALPTSSAIGIYNVTIHVNYLGRNALQSQWVLLVPLITLMIVGATVLLILALVVLGILRKIKRRRHKNIK